MLYDGQGRQKLYEVSYKFRHKQMQTSDCGCSRVGSETLSRGALSTIWAMSWRADVSTPWWAMHCWGPSWSHWCTSSHPLHAIR